MDLCKCGATKSEAESLCKMCELKSRLDKHIEIDMHSQYDNRIRRNNKLIEDFDKKLKPIIDETFPFMDSVLAKLVLFLQEKYGEEWITFSPIGWKEVKRPIHKHKWFDAGRKGGRDIQRCAMVNCFEQRWKLPTYVYSNINMANDKIGNLENEIGSLKKENTENLQIQRQKCQEVYQKAFETNKRINAENLELLKGRDVLLEEIERAKTITRTQTDLGIEQTAEITRLKNLLREIYYCTEDPLVTVIDLNDALHINETIRDRLKPELEAKS